MSATEIKLPLKQAQRLANRLVEILTPHCERIDIVGSVRRQKQEVGDIEIVCQPKRINFGLFADATVIDPNFFLVLTLFERLMGNPDNNAARYFKYKIPTGWASPTTINLDLFLPQASDYYRQLAIRTGSVGFSKETIANGWRKLGWVGTEDGLRREDQVEKKGEKWVCNVPASAIIQPPIWESEKDFFEWLKIEYVEPNERI
jgi:DNA polymerase/3'-5' exonuclease PolX